MAKALGGSRRRRRGRRSILELHGRGGVVFRVLPELQGRVGNGAVPGRLALDGLEDDVLVKTVMS